MCVADGNNGTVIATSNGGVSWSKPTSGVSVTMNAISCPSTSMCVATGTSGTIILSTNGGTTWTSETSGSSANLEGVSCPSTTTCYAVGASSTVLNTTNGAITWTAQTGAAGTLDAVSCPLTTMCFAASGTSIYETSNGTSWSGGAVIGANSFYGISFAAGAVTDGIAVGNVGTTAIYVCGGGSLGLSSPSSFSFTATALNGLNQTATGSAMITPDDETASGAGWSLSAYATPFSDGHGNTLAAPDVTAGTAAAQTGTCSLPANSVTYPTAALGATSPTATKLFDAAVGTGSGPANVTLTFSLPVPGNQLLHSASDTFSSTVTFTVSSGP